MMSNLSNPAPLVRCGPPGIEWVMGFDIAHHQIARAPFKSAAALFTVSSGPLLTSAPSSNTHAGANFAAGEHTCADKDSHQWRRGHSEGGGGLQSIGNRSDKEFLSKTKFMNANNFFFFLRISREKMSRTGVISVQSHDWFVWLKLQIGTVQFGG